MSQRLIERSILALMLTASSLPLKANAERLTCDGLWSKTQSRPQFATDFQKATFVNAAAYKKDVDAANMPFLKWGDKTRTNISNWLSRRGEPDGPPWSWDFSMTTTPVKLKLPTPDQAAQAKHTHALFFQRFPFGMGHTFFESGEPVAENGFQWNSHRWSGMNTKLFEESVIALKKENVTAIRIGIATHELDPDKPQTWAPFEEKMAIFKKHGISPTVSIDFFSSMKRFEVKNPDGTVDYKRSYHLNPEYPKFMERIAEQFMKRFGDQVKMVNPVNEPETLAGFNTNFWHGAFPGWSSPEKHQFYIPRMIAIAKASVRIRMGASRFAKNEMLWMHNEAMTGPFYPSFGDPRGRFTQSKLMLGDDVLMKADFGKLESEPLSALKARLNKKDAKLNEVEWMLKEFVFGAPNTTPALQEAARKTLIKELTELRSLHDQHYAETKKSVRENTILALDFYIQTEFQPLKKIPDFVNELVANNGKFFVETLGYKPEKRGEMEKLIGLKPGEDLREFLTRDNNAKLKEIYRLKDHPDFGLTLGFDPEFYARQMRAGLRVGLSHHLVEYINALGIYAFAIGESGTPFYTYAPMLHDQLNLETESVARKGAYLTFYAAGPADHTRGWAKSPLGLPVWKDSEVNPSGMLQVIRTETPATTEGAKPKVGYSIKTMPWMPAFMRPYLQDLKNFSQERQE